MKEIFLAFIPIFVAVDALGTLPIFVGLTHGITPKERNKIILESLITALSLALAFIILGKAIFKFLGITVGDFMIAGGGILFCIAMTDLIRPGKARRQPSEELGAVPIGTPLVVGPAVLTTCLMIIDQYGVAASIIAVFANILLVGVIFYFSERILQLIGQAGARALSKVMALFLAAIAVMMIRKGLMSFLLL